MSCTKKVNEMIFRITLTIFVDESTTNNLSKLKIKGKLDVLLLDLCWSTTNKRQLFI